MNSSDWIDLHWKAFVILVHVSKNDISSRIVDILLLYSVLYCFLTFHPNYLIHSYILHLWGTMSSCLASFLSLLFCSRRYIQVDQYMSGILYIMGL